MAEQETEDSQEEKTSFPLRAEKKLIKDGKALAKKRGTSLAALLRGLLIRELEAEEKGA